ncbi:MAG: Spy/CpxP family protein refolding chaperone [Ottowia sp.]|nr:Spy/CpxP family protein refolding chaperone [Ottowia sp.]
MKHALIALITGLLLAVSAWAQPSGMGPGMMGGHGYDQGGYGMGWGMMGNDGAGPGYGRGGFMGPGMMGGYGCDYIPDLTDEQRAKIADIEKEFGSKQWELMGKMREQRLARGGAWQDGKFDEQAARDAYDAMAALRKQMFENSLQKRKSIDDVLTPQQRDQQRRGRGNW